jgi:hypothetical protein
VAIFVDEVVGKIVGALGGAVFVGGHDIELEVPILHLGLPFFILIKFFVFICLVLFKCFLDSGLTTVELFKSVGPSVGIPVSEIVGKIVGAPSTVGGAVFVGEKETGLQVPVLHLGLRFMPLILSVVLICLVLLECFKEHGLALVKFFMVKESVA